MDVDTLNVRRYFADRHIQLQNDWETEAIRYVKLNAPKLSQVPADFNVAEAVFEQFLYSDLKESLVSPLSVPTLARKIHIVKPAVVLIVDISESLYSQYKTITSDLGNDDADFQDPSEIPPEPITEIGSSKNRVLQVELSDGEITLAGVVTDPVPGLNSSTVPGTKILLIPRVLCRRHCIWLTTSNCEVLGGCSELLMGQNWPILRVLCQMLKINYQTAMDKAIKVKGLMQSTLHPRRTALPVKHSLPISGASRTSRSLNELVPGSLEDSGLGSDDDAGFARNERNPMFNNNNCSLAESIAPPQIRRTFPNDDPTLELDPPKPERMLSLLKKQPRKKATSKKADATQALILKGIPRPSRDCVPETPASYFNDRKSMNMSFGNGPMDKYVQPIPPEELSKPVPTVDEYKKRIQPCHTRILKPSPADEVIFKKPFLPVRPTKNVQFVDDNPHRTNVSRGSEETTCAALDELSPSFKKKKQPRSPVKIMSQYNNVLSKPFNSVIVIPHVPQEDPDCELEDPKPTVSMNDSLFDGTVMPSLERKTGSRRIDFTPPLVKKERTVSEENSIIEKYRSLRISRIVDVLGKCKYFIKPERRTIMPLMCRSGPDITFKSNLWVYFIFVTDESVSEVKMKVDSKVVDDLLGFTLGYALKVSEEGNTEAKTECHQKAVRMSNIFNQRLDLVFEVEFSFDPTILPVIKKVDYLANVLNVV